MRTIIDDDLPEPRPRRRSPRLWPVWLAILILALGLGYVYWFGVRADGEKLAALPEIKNVAAATTQHLEALQKQVLDKDIPTLRRTLSDVESNARVASAQALAQAKELAEEAVVKMKVQLQEDQLKQSRLEAWLNQMEADRGADGQAVAALRSELQQTRAAVDRQQKAIETAEQRTMVESDSFRQRLAGVRDEVQATNGNLKRLEGDLKLARVDFEVTKDQGQDIAEGVQLVVTKTDVLHRRVNGWIWVMPDRKTVWLRGTNALEPVSFYSDADGMRRELVITAVTDRTAVGYLLVPRASWQAQGGGSSAVASTRKVN